MLRTGAIAALALLASLASLPAQASDEKGRFMMKGIGAKSCQDMLRSNGVTREQLDVFLDGFVTAINIDRDDTYDIVPASEWDRALEWITAYCGENRGHPLSVAAFRMVEAYFPRRLKASPNR